MKPGLLLGFPLLSAKTFMQVVAGDQLSGPPTRTGRFAFYPKPPQTDNEQQIRLLAATIVFALYQTLFLSSPSQMSQIHVGLDRINHPLKEFDAYSLGIGPLTF